MPTFDMFVSAPLPMQATFAKDYLGGGGVKLVEPVWPGRLLISGALIAAAKRDEACGLTFDRNDDGYFRVPLVARFQLENGAATYIEIADRALADDVYEFDCVQWSRDLD